ncbi:lipase family protein [Shewanella sp. TC10]|uniref:lipase family protein n=1 Tax=Shewanella sp. TC10 TaxID=1419739 RepID=UPI00129ED440|nr:Mbeg1-like protein [Shewanella sp. TC10]
MKKLKRYQYERYAVLCKVTYRADFAPEKLGFSPEHYREIANRWGNVCARILWREDKKEVLVVFRGSQTMNEWLINCQCWPKSKQFADIKYNVHAGYDYLLEQKTNPIPPHYDPNVSLFSQLQMVLYPLIVAGKRISLTGHSSGGSMAILAADRLERLYPNSIKRVVTFGQPSPGFKSFQKAYLLHRRTYRICCDIDVVTFLPPLPGIFFHVGKMLWLHNERIYENTSPVKRFVLSFFSWIVSPFAFHYMHKYIRNKDFFDEI